MSNFHGMIWACHMVIHIFMKPVDYVMLLDIKYKDSEWDNIF